jgi:CheY-like chemotaxis protein
VLRSAESGNQLPALILLDIDLPKMDGFEVLGAIRADPRQRAIPVIVFTASPDQRQVRRAYELGANAYVCKPLDQFVDVVGDLERFWLQRAQLPAPEQSN